MIDYFTEDFSSITDTLPRDTIFQRIENRLSKYKENIIPYIVDRLYEDDEIREAIGSQLDESMVDRVLCSENFTKLVKNELLTFIKIKNINYTIIGRVYLEKFMQYFRNNLTPTNIQKVSSSIT